MLRVWGEGIIDLHRENIYYPFPVDGPEDVTIAVAGYGDDWPIAIEIGVEIDLADCAPPGPLAGSSVKDGGIPDPPPRFTEECQLKRAPRGERQARSV